MKLFKIILFLFISFISTSFSQSFRHIASYPIDVDVYSRITLYRFITIHDKPYYYNINLDTNCFVNFVSFDSKSKLNLKMPEKAQLVECSSSLISNIVFRNDTLFLIKGDYLLMYQYTNDSFVCTNIIDLNDLFNTVDVYYSGNLLWVDNTLYCISDRIRFVEPYYYIWNYDISKPENSKFTSLEKPYDLIFSLIQPKRLAAFERNKLITTQLSEYKLYVHNNKYEIADTIQRTKTEWTNDFSKNDFQLSVGSKENLFGFLQNHQSKFYIHTIDLIKNDIMVAYQEIDTKNNKSKYYYDFWQNINGKWELKYKELDSDKLYDTDGNKFILKNTFFVLDNIIYTFKIDFKNIEESRLEAYSYDE